MQFLELGVTSKLRPLPAPLRKRPAVERVVSHLDQPVGKAAVEPPLVALAAALRQRLQRGSESSAAFRIEHAADPQHPALTLRQAQRTGLRHFSLVRCKTLGIDGMSVVMAEVAESTHAEVFCFAQQM